MLYPMKEGWVGEEFLTILDEREAGVASVSYAIDRWLPGYSVVGLRSWDDLLVRSPSGEVFSVPAVPIALEHLEPYAVPLPEVVLEADPQFAGKVKWYTKPIAFGGSPTDEANITWVAHDQHAELVVWWNGKYQDLRASAAGV